MVANMPLKHNHVITLSFPFSCLSFLIKTKSTTWKQANEKKSVSQYELIICTDHVQGYLWSKLYQILKSQALSCLVLLLSGPSVILICVNTENVDLEVFLQTLEYLSVSQGAHLPSYLDQSPLPLCERKGKKNNNMEISCVSVVKRVSHVYQVPEQRGSTSRWAFKYKQPRGAEKKVIMNVLTW